MDFYTVIFLDCESGMAETIKDKLIIDQNIRAFRVSVADELDQVVLQSYKVFVIVDKMNSLSTLYQVTTRRDKIKLLTVCFDHSMLLSDSEINYLKTKNIRVVPANKELDLINKIEFYFFGRTNVLGKTKFEKDEIQTKKNAYFTLLKNFNQKFKVIVSSHFRDEKINFNIGRDFEDLIENIVQNPTHFKEKKERELEGSEYIEVIYPVVVENYIDYIGIVHLKKCDDIEDKKQKLQAFIYNMVNNNISTTKIT